MHLDRIERWVLSQQQVVASLVAAGAKDVTWPDFESARTEFDARLVDAPRPVDAEKLELMRALGVAS